MNVGSVYRVGVFTIDQSDPLSEAASRMQFNEVGSLAVFEASRFVGIVTERDLVRAMADGIDAEETAVRAYTTEDPVAVTPDTEVAVAAATMWTSACATCRCWWATRSWEWCRRATCWWTWG